MPAEPQQVPPSAMSISVTPGMRAAEAARLRRDSLGVAEVARVVVGDSQVQLSPWRRRAEFGQVLAEVANRGTERRSPLGPLRGRQPATSRTPSSPSRIRPRCTVTASTPACSNVAMVARANAAASARRPPCSDKAPQHPCPGGQMTSQPSAARTRAVAAFTCGKKTCCTHPVSMPTTARRGPWAAVRAGTRPSFLRARVSQPVRPAGRVRPFGGGATASAAAASGANRASSLLRLAIRSRPVS